MSNPTSSNDYEREVSRNFCCVCAKELASAEFVGEWGCDCHGRFATNYRACEACHSKHHHKDNMMHYDSEYADD